MDTCIAHCPLCHPHHEICLYQNERLRIILVDTSDYPGYVRVIWTAHKAEMTDLQPEERDYLMHVVFAVETVVRKLCKPDKINLAALGNQVPHVHWHIIPRWQDDPNFPDSIWATAKRTYSASRAHLSLENWQTLLRQMIDTL